MPVCLDPGVVVWVMDQMCLTIRELDQFPQTATLFVKVGGCCSVSPPCSWPCHRQSVIRREGGRGVEGSPPVPIALLLLTPQGPLEGFIPLQLHSCRCPSKSLPSKPSPPLPPPPPHLAPLPVVGLPHQWKDGQGSSGETERVGVGHETGYACRWEQSFEFPASFLVDQQTNVPLPRLLHLSVRQVGGRTCHPPTPAAAGGT